MIDFKTKYRQYKIAEVLEEEFEDKEFLKMLDHIKKTITNPDFKEFVDDKHPNYIFIGLSKDDIYMEHDLKIGHFWLNYDKIWSFFESEFGYNYQQIKNLTEGVLELHCKLKEVTTIGVRNPPLVTLGLHFKLKEVTTYGGKWLNNRRLDNTTN